MEDHINVLSDMGLLSCFVGMITDSRSLVSFSRHEYFRRILCNLLAEDMIKGLVPSDEKWIGGMVEDICYKNAKTYLNI
jgi:glucuronate isomerase